jgi:hypothetical protein
MLNKCQKNIAGGKEIRKNNRSGKHDQNTLYACMEIPQYMLIK